MKAFPLPIRLPVGKNVEENTMKEGGDTHWVERRNTLQRGRDTPGRKGELKYEWGREPLDRKDKYNMGGV